MHWWNTATAIWISWSIDIPRSLNSCDSFPRWKLENWAPTSCRSGVDQILSLSTVSFELHTKMAEETDVEKCRFQQFSEVQKLSDLGLRSGQGHTNIHSTCRITRLLNHVTVASRITEIWPFEFCEISTFHEVWTLVIAFLEGNLKIGLW